MRHVDKAFKKKEKEKLMNIIFFLILYTHIANKQIKQQLYLLKSIEWLRCVI